MRALIIDHGLSRSALAATRALADAGWEVGIGSPARGGLADGSRACARWHDVPAPEIRLDAFVASVAKASRDGRYEVVLPSDDAQLLALSARRDELGLRVPYAEHDVVLRATDKAQLTSAARAVDIRVPETVEATEDALRGWRGPAMVKARLHNPLRRDGAPAHLLPVRAADAAEARTRAEDMRAQGGEPLLQEVVDGALTAVTMVTDRDGRPVARVQQEAEALWPPQTGISARARTVSLDDELAERVEALLRGLGWFGLAEAQFLRGADGQPRLIDLNGRLYGSLALSVAAGVNLAAVWAALATDRHPAKAADPSSGVRYHWLEGDLRRALAERRGGLLVDLAGTLRYALRARHSILSWRDPRPALRYGVILARRALSRRARAR
jgi:predicted ATP-grasp superfamily ATP-dependent carboligase